MTDLLIKQFLLMDQLLDDNLSLIKLFIHNFLQVHILLL